MYLIKKKKKKKKEKKKGKAVAELTVYFALTTYLTSISFF